MQFEGGRSAEELRKFWQNWEHPSINKQEWTGQEVDQLKAIAAKHGHLHWQKIAEELGVRGGPGAPGHRPRGGVGPAVGGGGGGRRLPHGFRSHRSGGLSLGALGVSSSRFGVCGPRAGWCPAPQTPGPLRACAPPMCAPWRPGGVPSCPCLALCTHPAQRNSFWGVRELFSWLPWGSSAVAPFSGGENRGLARPCQHRRVRRCSDSSSAGSGLFINV